ncbi:hypothetical protein D3C78_1347910 [compost metagenome]
MAVIGKVDGCQIGADRRGYLAPTLPLIFGDDDMPALANGDHAVPRTGYAHQRAAACLLAGQGRDLQGILKARR